MGVDDDKSLKRKRKAAAEASREYHDRSSESEESEEEAGENEYQKDDFVVSDNEESEEEEEESREDKKPGRRAGKAAARRADSEEDEEDENEEDDEDEDYQAGIKKALNARRKPSKGRLKRIKKLEADEANSGDREGSRGEAGSGAESDGEMEAEEDGESEEGEDLYFNQKPGVLNRIFDEEKIEWEERKRREQQEQTRLQDRTISHLFEPADLIRNFETPADKLIVDTDLPERLQLLFRHRDEPTQAELSQEAEWMLRQLSSHRGLSEKEEEGLAPRLLAILKLLREGGCEVMYIWTYKQPSFNVDAKKHPGAYQLRLPDLWYVFEMDQEWRNVWAKMDVADKLLGLLEPYQRVSESIQSFRRAATSSKHLDWLIHWAHYQNRKMHTFDEMRTAFELMNIRGNVSTLSGNKTMGYEMTQRGLTAIAESFSLTADQLAENLVGGHRVHRLPAIQERPKELSDRSKRLDFPQFKDPIQVFQEMLGYLALEYFNHPVVRKVMFQEMRALVTLNTEPTDQGKSMTVYDYFYPAKRVTFKRPDADVHNLWLLMTEAESKGLVKILFRYEGASSTHLAGRAATGKQSLRARLAPYLLTPRDANNELDVVSDQWNKVRENIIIRLIDNHLIPSFEESLRRELTEAAERFVFQKCANTLRDLVNTKPYRIKDPGAPPLKPSSVLACANDEEAALFVVLRENGEVVSFVELRNLLKKPMESNLTQQELYREDLKRLRDFVERAKPGVIVVAPKNLRSHNLKMELFNIADSTAKAAETRVPFVMWGNSQISSAFAKSGLSEHLLPGYSILFKEAISTGRFIQNPLAETLNIWSENEKTNGLLQLSLHRFQHLVNPYKLKNKLENLMVELVNAVGVELDTCVKSQHLAGQLQFVCGLGPRKAGKLLDRIRKTGAELGGLRGPRAESHRLTQGVVPPQFHNYRSFLADFELLGPIVSINAIGFLRVTGRFDFRTYPEGADDLEWLDCTRIHPDDYATARTICTSVVEGQNEFGNQNVLAVLKNPGQLDGYNLEDYGHFLSAQSGSNMMALVDFIIKELKEPFAEERPDFPTRLENQEIFYRLSGESRYAFLEGAIITARIIGVSERGLKVLTGSELIGLARLSDPRDDPAPESRPTYIVGNFVRAKINRINYEELMVDLSLRTRDLQSHSDFLKINRILEWYEIGDGHGFRVVREEDYPRNLLEARAGGRSFQSRKVSHPYFKNIGLEKAQEFLAERTRGEFLFRPSSKGSSFINITWKMFDEFYVHLIVKEGPKLPNEEVSRKLELLNKEYESLDQIISNYLRPCNKVVDGLLTHEKFTLEGIEKTRSLLLDLKANKPSLIPYMITVAKEYPRFLILCYAAGREMVRYELVQVKPNGLGFHQQVFSNLEYLIKFFKDNVKSKEYQKYVESLPKVDFGWKDREKKEEARDLPYAKEEMRRRGFRDLPTKREYVPESNTKNEYVEPYGRPRPEYGVRAPPAGVTVATRRRKGSEDSLEYDRQSPPRFKREADAPVKVEQDDSRGGTRGSAAEGYKRQAFNFEAA